MSVYFRLIPSVPEWETKVPIYEYQCEACGAVRDIKHGFKETTAEVCATCGGKLKRLFKPAGIVFKGSGFYVTDSRKSDQKSEAKSETKSESKPEPKAEVKAEGPKSDGGGKSDAAA
jgi:putative FmdB family regulatory protein